MKRSAICAIDLEDLKALLRKRRVKGLRGLKAPGKCAVKAVDLERHLKRRKKKR